MDQSQRFKLRWVALPVLLVLVFYIWTTDKITLQGERTIYTVNCLNGSWDGNRCSGEIAAGSRFRYRALMARGEVLFWVLGAPEPSSKLTGCKIENGRNWICPESVDAPKSLTLALSGGSPARNPAWSTRPFHSVSKVSWLLLRFGLKFVPVMD